MSAKKYYFSFFTILTLICLYISLSGFQIVEKFNGIVEVQDFGEMYEVSAILYGICDDKDLGKSVL